MFTKVVNRENPYVHFNKASSFKIKIFRTRAFYKNPKKVLCPFFSYLKAGTDILLKN